MKEKFEDMVFDKEEPWYEAKDIGCNCQLGDGPIQPSEWKWDQEEQCYICIGCDERQ